MIKYQKIEDSNLPFDELVLNDDELFVVRGGMLLTAVSNGNCGCNGTCGPNVSNGNCKCNANCECGIDHNGNCDCNDTCITTTTKS